MERSNRKFKLIVVVLVLLVCFFFSVFLSRYTYDTDFPAFYYAASTILDRNTPYISVYDIDTDNRYSIPEVTDFHTPPFIYSIPAAFIIAPLGLMPYFEAKAAMIFINIMMYLAAITIILKMGGVSGRWFTYPLALLCLWWPFIQTLRHGQVNGILLFLIALAVLAATKNHPILCGIFLAMASLFKLFPIAIAMVLGIKNWRVFTSCIVAFAVSFIIPGSLEWFQGIKNIYGGNYAPIFLWLKQFGLVWYWVYAAIIAGFSAFIVYRAKSVDYPLFASFAIPTALLTMPIIQYNHLTLLAFSYSHIIVTTKRYRYLMLTAIIFSFILINISWFFFNLFFLKIIVSFGLFVFWGAFAHDLLTSSSLDGHNI
jgi:hypothetical protein